ncbi:ExbD/TolR family protein [Desulfurobacterium atlanticum]|uniref:Outer membrane transport energization protein ExbD n=1 Tax=Desulfurobacterium atlanticum TaxID=240169 RepID=A0A238YYR7_9BACT|nr:biopolymer transporter ExbD [Desulfurobacterium atlanticum]SNR75669.1 outer membrane transport energization protein ExbD [Desulfurobacterium atlanticum]
MIEFRKKKDDESILDIAPLVDMVFLLLIFFLLTNTYQKHQIGVSLPVTETGNEAKVEKKTYLIEIKPDGTILLNGKKVSINQLKKLPKTAEVDIAGDRKVNYETFMEVLDRLKEAGINNVNLLTIKK